MGNTSSNGVVPLSYISFRMFHRSEKVRSLKWEKIFEKPHPSNCHHFPFESCMGIHLHIQSSDFRKLRTRWVRDPVISGVTWGPCKWPKIWLFHQIYDWILGPRIVSRDHIPPPFFVDTSLGFPSHTKLSVENFQQKPSRVPKPHAPSRSQ